MLRALRENVKGTTGKVLLAIIIVPFVFIGGMEFLRDGDADAAMIINGETVSRSQLLQEMYRLRNEIANRMGEQLTADAISEQRLIPIAKQRLTERTLLDQAISAGGVEIPERAISETIVTLPEFQLDGKFSADLMQSALAGSGMSDSDLKESVSDFIRSNQLRAGFVRTGFSSPREASFLRQMIAEERVIHWARLSADTVKQQIDVSDEQLENYFQSVQSEYQTQLMVDAEYISLKLSDLFEEVDDAEVREAYDVEKNNFIPSQQRDVAHILLEVNDGQTAEEARQKLTGIRARAEAGEDFADLAKQYSQDPGSSEDGGALGFIEQDESFPPAFEEAAFETDVGAVSEIVETDAGLHIVKVLGVETEDFPDFESRKELIARQLQRSAARKLFVEQKELLADETYSAEGLADPADNIGLQLLTAKSISRSGPIFLGPPGDSESEKVLEQDRQAIFNSSLVLDTLFSDDMLAGDLNSEIIEIDDEHVVVVRVAGMFPSRQQTLAEVRDTVLDRLLLQEAKREMAAQADALKATIAEGESFETVIDDALNPQLDIAVTRNSRELAGEFLTAVFESPRSQTEGALQEFSGANGDLYLFQLRSVGESQDVEGLTDDIILRQGGELSGQVALARFRANLLRKAEIVDNEL